MAEKTCLGIDIGNNRLKVAVKSHGSVKKMISEVVPDGLMSENHLVSYDAMGDFLREVLKRNRVSIKKAHLCMPIHEVYLRTAVLPMMSISQLRVNLPYEFHDYITEDMDRYVYDYSVLPDTENDGQLHLLTVAASKELISSHLLMARRARIHVESIQPANMPLFRVLEKKIKESSGENGPQDFAIVDLGDTSIKIHFFTKGQYEVTRSMDYGFAMASERISEELGQDIHLSRVNMETNVKEVLSEPFMEDVFTDLASRIMRVLNFYNFNNRDNTLEDLYYFGGGALIKPFLDILRESIPLNLKSAGELLDIKGKITEDEILLGLQAIGLTM